MNERDCAITERDRLLAERDRLSKTLDAVHRRLVANSSLFDGAWYLKNNPDVAEAGLDPLDHYFISGAAEGRSPGPRFDPDWYLSHHPDIAELGISPLVHYLERGGVEPQPPESLDAVHRRLVANSWLFDGAWYLKNNLDVAEAGLDPLDHYLSSGAAEGRSPGPWFDPDWYLSHHPEVAALGVSPLVYYLEKGGLEPQLPNPVDALHRRLVVNSSLFDGAWYLKNNPDVAQAGFDPLDHYFSSGAAEGRPPGPRFDPAWYLSQHPDAALLGISPLVHYLERGGVEPQPPRKEIPPNIRINFPLTTQFVAGLQWYDRNTPDVSLVILSYLRPDLVENLIKSIWLFTDGYSYEIIVVDNGSPSGAHGLEDIIKDNVRVITLNSIHYLGDAYNIGVEHAKGKYVILLNNDIVVTKGWFSALIDQLQLDPKVGVVGPKFLYPSGELQEAGAFIAYDGRSVQRGKGGNADDREFNVPGEVDYCSGACIAINRELYLDVLGYDWRWAPGYYEDVDLCFKIKDRGLSVFYVPESVVFHIESATRNASPPPLGDIASAIEDNRITLLRKWSGLLEPSDVNKAIRITPPDGVHLQMFREVVHYVGPKQKTLAILLPYEFIPGGGQNYCLSILERFSTEAALFLIFPDLESVLRVNSVIVDLGFKNLRYHVITLIEAQKMPPFDTFIFVGNELFPTSPGLGNKNFYICQFPHPLSHATLWQLERTGNHRSFERYIVYSKFVERHVVERLAAREVAIPVSVVEPPVDFIGTTTDLCQHRIVGVGRFFAGGHNKRHDILIEAMRALAPRIPSARLHLAGAVHKEEVHRLRLRHLRDDAADLPVSFHVDIGREELEGLYRQSSVYWHAAGWGVNVDAEPERAEHFGITVLEAMSAGCIPIVYAAGGPLEVVKHGINGLVVASIAELVEWTVRIMENWDTPLFKNMRQQALQTAQNYDKEAFGRRLRAVVGFPDRTDAVLAEAAFGPRNEPTPVANGSRIASTL